MEEKFSGRDWCSGPNRSRAAVTMIFGFCRRDDYAMNFMFNPKTSNCSKRPCLPMSNNRKTRGMKREPAIPLMFRGWIFREKPGRPRSLAENMSWTISPGLSRMLPFYNRATWWWSWLSMGPRAGELVDQLRGRFTNICRKKKEQQRKELEN